MGVKTVIAVLDKRDEDATAAVVSVLKALSAERSDYFGVATPTTCTVKKDADNLQSQRVKSATVVGYTFPKTLSHSETQSARLANATLVFMGRIYSPTQNVSAAEFVANKLKQNHCKAAEAILDEVEGDFAFIIAEPEGIIAGRDPIGVQPLYYGENRNVAALAANRKALWKLGLEKVQSFPPGHLAVVSREGFKFKPAKTLVYAKPKPVTMQDASGTLQKLLEDSVRKRVWGLKEVAVAFSGGLDSSVIAFLAKKCRVNVHLIHVSLKNQPETDEARKAAYELKLPIQVYLFEEEEVEKVAAKVVGLIEEPDPVKLSIGVPFYWAAEKTAEAGFKVLLAGQGADELFGGYQRYVNDYLLHEKEVRKKMFNDVVKLHESNIERDVKICSFFDVEFRLPYASYAIADFALSLPLELKIEKKTNSLRKLVLRKAAENMGLPAAIAEKPKKAIQYSTGINDTLKKMAKKQNATVNEYVNKLFLKSIQP
ncbi:asparagine synthetase B [Candidatus Bathyarchaeota archaeon]|nr:asparagine synthetase B [Candidatus Bathyarchaeota archaeon]